MLTAYVFSAVLGGGFLLLSVFGDLFGADAADVEMDMELDLDTDLELDAGVDADHGYASKIFSIRTVVYALFGFGAVGSLLTWLGVGGATSTFFSALTGGALTGALISAVFTYLKATDSGAQLEDASFVGLSGTVTLPLSSGVPGTVAVERGARRVSLRALPHETTTGDPSTWKSVVVVEMNQGIARVAPVVDDLLLEP